MNPTYPSDQQYADWMSPADARRSEFAALTVDMVDCLESLERVFRGRDSRQQDTSAYQYASSMNYNAPAPLSTIHAPYYNDLYPSQTVLPSSLRPSQQVLESTKTSNQLLPSYHHLGSAGRNYDYSLATSPSGMQAYGNATTPEYASARITNQKRPESMNRGGSLRREAPADKVCGFCQASFTRNERLRYHIDNVHLKLEPEYGCDVPGCQRAFRQRSDLLRHQRTVHRSLFPK